MGHTEQKWCNFPSVNVYYYPIYTCAMSAHYLNTPTLFSASNLYLILLGAAVSWCTVAMHCCILLPISQRHKVT